MNSSRKCRLLHGVGRRSQHRQTQRLQIGMEKLRQSEKSTSSTFIDDNTDKKTDQQCALKDGKHALRKCEKHMKITCQARYEKDEELKLGFCCLTEEHVKKDCSYRACGVKGCSTRHHHFLNCEANGRPEEKEPDDPQQKAEVNSAFCFLKSSGNLPVIPGIVQI